MSGLAIADTAYRALLRLPFTDRFRIRNQGLYAALVDAIAREIEVDVETVQNYYESRGNGVDLSSMDVLTKARAKSILEEIQRIVGGAAGQEK